jgi:hypothetical protein
MTALCPARLCPPDEQDRAVDYRTLAADIGVLYLHAIAPQDLAVHLPPLAGAWRDFARAGSARLPPQQTTEATEGPLDLGQRFDEGVIEGRHAQFERFLGGFDGDPVPTLHFLHLLLPHHPYQYLPSGRWYSDGAFAEGLHGDGTWSSAAPLVRTGYEQYLAQLGFVDALLGRVTDRLKDLGLYEDALIVVTADHGSAFRPGERHRILTPDNYRPLAAVPLFIKLPGQRGGVDDRMVSALDIAPTVADVLERQLPWRVDGRSLLRQTRPELQSIELENQAFPVFDVRAARDGLYAGDLAAERAESMAVAVAPVDSPAAGARVSSQSFFLLRQIDLASPFVPALIRGEIITAETQPAEYELAIAINGSVGAATRTAEWAGARHYFAALVPEAAFKQGSNDLDVYLVDRSQGKPRLRRIAPLGRSDFTLTSGPDGAYLTAPQGPLIQVGSGAVGGWVDRVDDVSASVLEVHGWAADLEGRRSVRQVIVFAGTEAIGSTATTGLRPDVAGVLGLSGRPSFGYMIPLRKERLASGCVRVIGLSEAGKAGRLSIHSGARARLNACPE